jgi:lipooligosaccharide transport system permease protein
MPTAAVAEAYEFSPRGAARMWQRNATVGRKTIATSLTPRFLEAIAYLAIMGLGLGAYLTTVEGVDYIDFIAPGVAASTVMFGAVIETTYNVVGEYLWAATRAVIYGVVFLIVMAAFGLVHSPLAILCPAVFLVGALTFAVLGMAYTAMVTNIEHFNILFTGIITPMFLFGGVFFPFSELPAWAQVIGWCLPLSHLAAATRELTLGDAGWITVAHVAVLLAILVAVFPFPARRMRRTLLR